MKRSAPPLATVVTVLAAVWVAVTLALIEPIQAALPSWSELSIDFGAMLGRLGVVALLVLCGLVPVALATRWLAPQRGPAIWTASCVVLWMQGDVFVWDYGTFDGTAIDWSSHSGKAWLEAAAWLGVPALAVWRADWVARYAHRILAAVVGLQLAGLASAAYQNAPYEDKPGPAPAAALSAREFARFSSRGNVILVVLDALQSDLFSEAMQSEELAARMPGGFVYYRNAIALYPATEFSLQTILTSRAIPSGVHVIEWRKWAMRRSLPVVLARMGFDSRMASWAPQHVSCKGRTVPLTPCGPLSRIVGPDRAQALEAEWRAEVSLLVRLGAFRLLPHLLKPRAYDAGEWAVPEAYPARSTGPAHPRILKETWTDIEALDRLASSLSVDDVAPRFRFLHLHSVHQPASIDSRCQIQLPRSADNVRERAVETTRCSLSRLYGFLDALDDAGVYDSSLIIVVADHGSRVLTELDRRVAAPPLEQAEPQGTGDRKEWWRLVPLFLAKQQRARGPLQISDHPVSLCDVPASVVDSLGLGLDGFFDCETIRNPKRRRARLNYDYYPGQGTHINFLAFRVDGHSWYASSWIRDREAETAARSVR